MTSPLTPARIALRYTRCRTRSARPPPSYSQTFATLSLSLASPPSTGTFTANPSPQTDYSFLEPESDEYKQIKLIPRAPGPLISPWPTLFAPATSQPITRTPSRAETGPLPCDLIARLISLNDLPAAAQVRDELLAVKTPIMPRQVYLSAALNALLPSAHATSVEATRESLLWFSLWFSFPIQTDANGHLPGEFVILRARLRRYLETVLDAQGTNPAFLEDLLLSSAPKGLTNILIRPLIPHLCALTAPSHSFEFLNTLISSYNTHHTAETGAPDIVFKQTRLWRNLHLQGLLENGWIEEAKQIYQAGLQAHPPVGWNLGVKELLLAKVQSSTSRMSLFEEERQDERDGWVEYHAASSRATIEATPLSLPRQILRSAHLRASQPLSDLSRLLTVLDNLPTPRPTLIALLRRQFLGTRPSLRQRQKYVAGSGRRRAHKANEATARFWWCAQMKRLENLRDWKGVREIWEREFYQVGLPNWREGQEQILSGELALEVDVPDKIEKVNMKLDIVGANPSTKLYPDLHSITVVLPSLLRLLPAPLSTSLPAYHNAYLAMIPSLPPSMRPDELTHLAFVKAYAAVLGAAQTEAMVVQMEQGGLEVGRKVWGMIGVAWAKEKKLEDVKRIWDRMRAPGTLPSLGEVEEEKRMEIPGIGLVPRTFLGPAHTLLRKKQNRKAMEVLRSVAEEFAEEGEKRLERKRATG